MLPPILTPELYHIKAERERFAWWVKVTSILLVVISVLKLTGEALGHHHHVSSLFILTTYIVYIFMLSVAIKGFKAAKLQTTKSTYLYKKLLIVLMIVMTVFYIVAIVTFGLKHNGNHHTEKRSLRRHHDEEFEKHTNEEETTNEE